MLANFNMKKRTCPLCGSNDSETIMRFSPELLSEINSTYNVKVLKNAVSGKEKLLTYSKCRKCKMIYCEHIWNEETLRLVYGDAIDHDKSKKKILSVEKRISINRLWINILRVLKLSNMKNLENLRVIDFGCGWGDFLDVVNGNGIDVIGFDGDSKKTVLPKRRGHRIAESIEELKAFGHVDVFVMISVLEHLQDVDFILNLCRELLKKNGLLVFTVMDYREGYIRKNAKRLEYNQAALTKNLNPIEHVNVYDYDSVMATLKKHDFNFISTGSVLYFTDTILTRNSKSFINLFNYFEKISSKLLTDRELGITVFSTKN
jgi:predicted SAM-dependent methyltransferase